MISLDGFCQFEQLIINYTHMFQPNTEQKLRTMNIQLCRRRWCIAGLTIRSSTLGVIAVYLLFIAGHDTMQKENFAFLPLKLLLTYDKIPFDVFRLQLVRQPMTLLWNNSKSFQTFQFLMILQVQFLPNIRLHETMSPIIVFKILRCASAFFAFNIKIIIFQESKPIPACCFWQSLVTVSLNENSVYFSCRFLLNKIVQWNSPSNTLSLARNPICLTLYLFAFYSISRFLGYLMPNPYLQK